jgi:hypothetical protein
VVGSGKSLSWDALRRAGRHDVPLHLIVDQAKDIGLDRAGVYLNDHVPVVGKPQDRRPFDNLVHSAATEIQHKVRIPRLTISVDPRPQTAGGGAW